jgi:uncharacterized protein (TIGR03382 family)
MRSAFVQARLIAVVGGVAALAGASAQGSISDPAVVVTASSQAGTGSMIVHLSEGVLSNDTWTWSMTQPQHIYSDSGADLGSVQNMACFLGGDPQANVTFGVMAGASPTNFTISSGLVSFSPIANAVGRASASITLTDLDGNGASLTGLQPGGHAYRANYNGAIPGGSIFTNLLATPETAGVYSSSTFVESTPAGPGFIPVAPLVSDMSAQYQFTLSANDSASGTSVFVITPAPATGTLLGLVGLAGLRRRRR